MVRLITIMLMYRKSLQFNGIQILIDLQWFITCIYNAIAYVVRMSCTVSTATTSCTMVSHLSSCIFGGLSWGFPNARPQRGKGRNLGLSEINLTAIISKTVKHSVLCQLRLKISAMRALRKRACCV